MLTNPFLIDLKQRYFEAFAPYIGQNAFVKQNWEFFTKFGEVEVNVSRGDIFEKACVSNISAKVTIPGRDYESSIQWLGVQTFPSNPMVPMLMGVFEHVAEMGTEHHPGFFDFYPVVPIEEDRHYFQEKIGAVCKMFGRTYPDLPQSYLTMFQLKEVGVGVGYEAGLAIMPDEESSEYFEAAANATLEAYFEIVDKRKDSPYTDEHIRQMDRFRAEWVRFIFQDNRFYQGGVQLGVPPESFMIHMLPPTVKF